MLDAKDYIEGFIKDSINKELYIPKYPITKKKQVAVILADIKTTIKHLSSC